MLICTNKNVKLLLIIFLTIFIYFIKNRLTTKCKIDKSINSTQLFCLKTDKDNFFFFLILHFVFGCNK